mmetsp:Transcript_141510/g.451981  ORF Transcript_141510/g.451981 Transcript_141510/m.451981 type:complete len:381 (-) Transcript_141510:308-1450(-)
MLSSRVVGGAQGEDAHVVAGGAVQWVLCNDGTVAWPAGTTLRLVGGPMVVCPIVQVPEVAPGQTVDIDLEVKETEDASDIFYSLVTPDGQPFGEIAHVKVEPKPRVAAKPAVVVLASPMDGVEGGIEALQGEVKSVEWVLANVGQVPWPEDVSATLIYNTPGFEHLPCSVKIPAIEPGMTAHAGLSILMPEQAGDWKAMWVVASPSHPEFGDILLAEFVVGDFPFMDWMLASEAEADSFSEISSQAPEKEAKKLSAAVAMQQHHFFGAGEVKYDDEAENESLVSLGCVSGMSAGSLWILELALTNDGTEAWPADVALTCCFGSGMGCPSVSLSGEGVKAGETVLLQMELTAPEMPAQTAWVVAKGEQCFGPAMMLSVNVQ